MKDTPQHIPPIEIKKYNLLGYLFLLTLFFILFEICLLIQGSDIYLGEYKLIADHLAFPIKILPGILYYLIVQLVLHFLFTIVIWWMARLIGTLYQFSWDKIGKLSFTLWVIGIVTILLANAYFFPNSKFADIILFSNSITEILFIISFSIMILAIFISLWSIIKLTPNIVLALTGIIFALLLHGSQAKIIDGGSLAKPNIILIGIDSLRPDFVGFFGYEKITPHLDAFLNHATVFSDAFSPLARTFPAWVSILSGEYPKKNGVRFNLSSSLPFDLQQTLPNLLKKEGYETIFATDETRFSNIDERFGFDKVLTPPTGVNDFLLGNLNDFPIANLIVNTPLGKYLFPNSYGNRPAFITYNPNSFLHLLEPTLAKSRYQPLFLAVHFCLPHYPYFWGTVSADDQSLRNYQASIQRVDQQFNDFFTLLKNNNLLKHSLVIVLSDHGEAIELPGDRITDPELYIPSLHNIKKIIPHFYPPAIEKEAVNQSTGHGTDVLGLTQYHVVLAAKTFGLEENKISIIPKRVSLLDIKPTVLDFLNLKKLPLDDGDSLKNLICSFPCHSREVDNMQSKNHFFIESDFSPQAVRSVHPETSKLLFEGIDYYQIDPDTTRISVKDKMAKLIITSKQYADIYEDWILALYPQEKGPMIPILVNLTTGKWTDDLRTSFAKQSPAQEMLSALKHFYKNDLARIQNS